MRPFHQELTVCQRYYKKRIPSRTIPVSPMASATAAPLASILQTTQNFAPLPWYFWCKGAAATVTYFRLLLEARQILRQQCRRRCGGVDRLWLEKIYAVLCNSVALNSAENILLSRRGRREIVMADYQLTATDAVIRTADNAVNPEQFGQSRLDRISAMDCRWRRADPYVLPAPMPPAPAPETTVLYDHENRLLGIQGQPPLTLGEFIAKTRANDRS